MVRLICWPLRAYFNNKEGRTLFPSVCICICCFHDAAESFIEFAVYAYSAQENCSSWPRDKKAHAQYGHSTCVCCTDQILIAWTYDFWGQFIPAELHLPHVSVHFHEMFEISFFFESFVFYFWINVLDTGVLSFHTKYFHPAFKNLNDLWLVKLCVPDGNKVTRGILSEMICF